jgi:streptomycin 6-kinase
VGEPIRVPDELELLRTEPGGSEWLAGLPALAATVLDAWQLRAGPRFRGGYAALTMPVTRPDGSTAVVKIQFPHRECEHEADALRAWAGNGAVRLLDHDRAHAALLVERCEPGTRLGDALPADAALDVLVGLVPRLWVPAAGGPFTPVAEEAARWSVGLAARYEQMATPYDRGWRDLALELLESLPRTAGPSVLVHQDLHGHNVLAAEREPWLVIDPKPLAAERELSVAPIVRSSELGHSRAAVCRRLDRLTAELGLDRDRARSWTIAQTLAWLDDPARHPEHLDVIRWLLDA